MAKLKGATLIETLAALTIIVLVSGIAFSLFGSLQESSKGTNDLKASFLAEKYLKQTSSDLSIEEDGYSIEKNVEQKENFELVNIRVLKKEELLFELNKWQEKGD